MAHISNHMTDEAVSEPLLPWQQSQQPDSSDGALTEEQRRTNLALWLNRVVNNLRMARSIVMPTDTMDYILETLFTFRFSTQQARIAEQWILFGDWTYRGRDAKLELSDFINPPMEQVEAIAKNRGMVILTHGEIRARERKAFETGRSVGGKALYTSDHKNPTAVKDGGKNDHSETLALVVKLNAEKMDLTVLVEEQRDEIDKLTLKLRIAQREINRLRQNQQDDSRRSEEPSGRQ